MLRILVADDHPVVRLGLKEIITKTPNMSVAGEAVNGQEVIDKVLANDYDVVLLDITMPGKVWLDVLSELRIKRPGLPVLVLSIHSEEEYAVRALRAGASGYLTKASTPNELVEAIRRVSMHHKYISSCLSEKVIVALEVGIQKKLHESLSNREFEVMCMIASGKTTSDIAKELVLSNTTISTYRARILEKMRVKSNAELTRYALQNSLIE